MKPADCKVLLADDDPAMLRLLSKWLAEAGYPVQTAGDGREALAMSDGHAGPIHLLLTDVVMPRMNGRELARELQARRPGVPVLYVSGYSEEVITRGGQLEPGITLLQKPFEPLGLARAVRRLLEGGAG
jgi:two-component system cell cycle sensor histidine kinase/response regulator CckA